MGLLPAACHSPDLVDLARGMLIAVCIDEAYLGGKPEQEAEFFELQLRLPQQRSPIPRVGSLDEALLNVDHEPLNPVSDREFVCTRKFFDLLGHPDQELETQLRNDLSGIGILFHVPQASRDSPDSASMILSVMIESAAALVRSLSKNIANPLRGYRNERGSAAVRWETDAKGKQVKM